MQEDGMAEAVKEPVLVHRRSNPRPKYHESAYRRILLRRLTPFTWFLIIFAMSSVVVIGLVLANRVAYAPKGNVLLPTRIAQLTEAVSNGTPVQEATPLPVNPAVAPKSQASKPAVQTATPTVLPSPTPTPKPVPTRNPNDAPWAPELVQQADGSYLAPQEVTDKVIADLSSYYTALHDLSLDDFLRQRYDMLNTYFTGSALASMRASEGNRKQYELNRAGVVVIQVRSFTSDGYTAHAGVMKRGWVNDIYDVTSRKLVAEGVADKNTLSVMTITYDRSSKRWMFASIEMVKEVEP
jgi:hypothetical protein